jgi:hypothetical protein
MSGLGGRSAPTEPLAVAPAVEASIGGTIHRAQRKGAPWARSDPLVVRDTSQRGLGVAGRATPLPVSGRSFASELPSGLGPIFGERFARKAEIGRAGERVEGGLSAVWNQVGVEVQEAAGYRGRVVAADQGGSASLDKGCGEVGLGS